MILASVPFLLEKEHPRLRVLFLAAVATVLIHPIAGIPALLYFMFLCTDPSRTNPRTPKPTASCASCSSPLPASCSHFLFVLNSLVSGQSLGWNWAALNP